MKSLEDMTVWERVALMILTVLIILFALALCSLSFEDEAPAAVSGAFFHSPFDQRLAELEHSAVDDAYMQRVHLLFQNWLNDSHQQPDRMLVGINNARRVYTEAMTEIEKREKR